MRFRQRLAAFMAGRYGIDNFGRFLLYLTLILLLISSFGPLRFLYLFAVLGMIYCYFRIFSRNVYKRSYENSKYLACKEKVLIFFRKLFPKKGYSDRSFNSKCNSYSGNVYEQQYRIFKCPNCKQKLRVPRGKGKIQITCRRCGNAFIKRS